MTEHLSSKLIWLPPFGVVIHARLALRRMVMRVRDGDRIRWLLVIKLAAIAVCLLCGRAFAADQPPPVLPRYDLDLKLDTIQHTATLRQIVTWTNTTKTPTNLLTFNFYPHYSVPHAKGEYVRLAKTLEMLRLQPSIGIARDGRHGDVKSARLLSLAGKRFDVPVPFEYDLSNVTAVRVPLPGTVNPGDTVSVELVCEYTLPNTQGRLGYWEGVSFLTNSTPLLAFYDDTGWRPMPFVPWHQPWFNEAGEFHATITLPDNEVLATPAATKTEVRLPNGWKQIETETFVGRDFAILASSRFKEFTTVANVENGKSVPIRCLAFPEHEFYAREIMRIAAEAIPVYSKWFGPYPSSQFTLVESFFGWNGNECAGLVMIDERVFAMPHLAVGYVEYLVSHETCHQWWYNLIGTNGYAETFMDEGAATYFSHRLLDQKFGKNNEFLKWPQGLEWLPSLKRDNYRYSGMYQAIRNHEMFPAAQPLPDYHSLFGLFTGAYDRGSKIFGMLEDQLGEVEFFGFIKTLVNKYAWRVLQVKDFRMELEAYTGRDWGEFFQRWVYGKGMTDWAVEHVEIESSNGKRLNRWDQFRDRYLGRRQAAGESYNASVIVHQKGEYLEPTVVGFTTTQPGFEGVTIRVPVGMSAPAEFPDLYGRVTPLGNEQWRVDVSLPFAPDQITVDPDHVLLDSDPLNNSWQPTGHLRFTACQTMLDVTPLTTDYAAWNFTAGPWVWGPSYQDPWYTRSTMAGVRLGAYLPQHFEGGVYSAFRTDFNDLVVGVDATWLGNHSEYGFNWERRIAGPWGGLNGDSGPERVEAYYRDIIRPTSSMYLEPVMYQDAFVTYQDNFLPFPRQAYGERYNHLTMAGYHYQWNMYTPYWDPEGGFFLDLVGAAGGVDLGSGTQGMVQGRFELAGVQSLPEWMGPLESWRIAARGVAMGALPNFGQFYSLGGSTLFRGFDLAQRQGNALWVGNLEMRIPLARNMECDALDHVVGARNLWMAAFYDVGEVFASGRPVDGVAHALGVGLRLDIALFSFIERATLRFDVAKTINAATPIQFWFGLQQAF